MLKIKFCSKPISLKKWNWYSCSAQTSEISAGFRFLYTKISTEPMSFCLELELADSGPMLWHLGEGRFPPCSYPSRIPFLNIHRLPTPIHQTWRYYLLSQLINWQPFTKCPIPHVQGFKSQGQFTWLSIIDKVKLFSFWPCISEHRDTNNVLIGLIFFSDMTIIFNMLQNKFRMKRFAGSGKRICIFKGVVRRVPV